MSFNKIILIGNLGRDPELKYTPQGNPVCHFTMATNERRRDRAGEQQDITTWFRVTLWGRQAELASQYLTKGQSVYIEGRLRLSEYNDREGQPRQSLEVNATDMQFIGGKQDDASYSAASPRPAPPASAAKATGGDEPTPELSDDDIPF